MSIINGGLLTPLQSDIFPVGGSFGGETFSGYLQGVLDKIEESNGFKF